MQKFHKYEGAGNDFILLEDFDEVFPEGEVSYLCQRRLGIGADGLILLRRSSIADYKMVFFNADGSKGAMCGNGLRCFVHFLIDLGRVQPLYKIEVAKKVLTVKAKERKISTFFAPPTIVKWEEGLYVVDSGVPHVVLFSRGEVDVEKEGRALRWDLSLHPEGVNVDFVQLVGKDALVLRTYERGVEAETLACGTGAVAASFVAHRLGLTGPFISVRTRSGDQLEVRLGREIELFGPSAKVYEGKVCILSQKRTLQTAESF
ncbi:MAG: Diaminopimelate epimerase [Chlamydiae bacterium]|nr:Diaminopimelate epimerase [Chlamydiota bacterium]